MRLLPATRAPSVLCVAFLSSALRPGCPNFLDLPWHLPFSEWRSGREEQLPRGESRNPVVFVNYDGQLFALKELDPQRAEEEYHLLREMEGSKLPVVSPVGWLRIRRNDGERSVLVTRYLERSLPYQVLFTRPGLERYRQHLLDAGAGLLVQLHLAGVFWGDCSLDNILFLRDAGTLNAVMVDAETSSIHDALTDAQRQHELDVMEENVAGALFDLVAQGVLPSDFPIEPTIRGVREKYDGLWAEVQREEPVEHDSAFAMEDRIRRLNALGFSVGELELSSAGGGVRLKAVVTDRSFHRDLVHSLTGLTVQERQAQVILNDLRQTQAALCRERDRSVSLSSASLHWMDQVFIPAIERIRDRAPRDELDDAERFCELLEHKWFLSEQAQRDVGRGAALDDYLHRLGSECGE